MKPVKPSIGIISWLVDGISALNVLGFSLVLFAATSPSVVINRSGLISMSVYGVLSFLSSVIVRFVPVRVFAVVFGVFYSWAIFHAWRNNSSVPPEGFHPTDIVATLLLVLLLLVQCFLQSMTRRESNRLSR